MAGTPGERPQIPFLALARLIVGPLKGLGAVVERAFETPRSIVWALNSMHIVRFPWHLRYPLIGCHEGNQEAQQIHRCKRSDRDQYEAQLVVPMN